VSETRKIAAILAADVVGYSRLAGADEDRTLARLRALRSDLIDPTIAVHNGRVVKRTGDGALVEFRSVVDAVRCAIEVQNAMVERNAGLPQARRIDFRIGIHLGDVVEESDGDLMGDGVNIAARLEGIAEPGAICLSEQAYWQVKGRLDLAVTDLGATRLKNIAEPVRAYSLQVGVPTVAKLAIEPKPLEPKKRSMLAPLVAGIVATLIIVAGGARYLPAANRSAPAAHLSIVVLPFANLSNDPAQDYFADGVTENLTTDLSRIKGSFVIARNTAYAFKGKSVDARDIGKQLGVRYVLEGSVQRDQSRVRVNAQLIDTETGAHLWADRFENDIVDLFKLQDDVVARLANSLDNELVKAEAQTSVRKVNPDVIDVAMRGQSLLFLFQQQPTMENLYAARVLFEQALKIDSNDADALAGDAFTHAIDFVYGWSNSGTDYSEKILAQADRAIAIAPHNRWAYVAKTLYLAGIHRANEALAVADAGLAINPNSADLFGGARGFAKLWLGQYEQAIADERQAIRLSPLDPEIGVWHLLTGDAELGLRHFEASIDESHKAINAGFRGFLPYRDLAAAFALQGKSDEAASALAEMRRQNPKLTMKVVIAISPNMPSLFEGLRKAGLPEE
jgi:adenylate cyclase